MLEFKWWIIVFDDTDRENLTFTDEKIAHETYDKFIINWNCHLFEQIKRNGENIR